MKYFLTPEGIPSLLTSILIHDQTLHVYIVFIEVMWIVSYIQVDHEVIWLFIYSVGLHKWRIESIDHYSKNITSRYESEIVLE